jgi:hypothetical protein
VSAPDTPASAPARDHAFEPRADEVSARYRRLALAPNPYLCQWCRLAEAAHGETVVER